MSSFLTLLELLDRITDPKERERLIQEEYEHEQAQLAIDLELKKQK